MDNMKELFQVLAIISSISGEYYDLDDIFIGSNPKVFSYSNKLLFEILDLLDDGYTEEEIITMINDSTFDSIKDLSNEQKEYLKKDAKKALKKVLKNRKGE